MVKVLITGGAGFMGRWVAKYLVEQGHRVWVLDDLSNSCAANIEEFRGRLENFVKGDIKDRALISKLFKNHFEICIHLAAAINVQESIDNPEKCFNDNVIGTFNILQGCRRHNTKMVFMSSALIYNSVRPGQLMAEDDCLNASCPYTASKIFGENLVTSYRKTYNLPTVILRPFSVYGPWQKSDSEGGVMSVFIDRKLKHKPIEIFGEGKQGRDLFYIEDCVEFIIKAAFSDAAIGEVFNAGSGEEVKIKELARIIADGSVKIRFVKHPHFYAEIMHMRADLKKAKKILRWKPRITLKEGIDKTTAWLKSQAR